MMVKRTRTLMSGCAVLLLFLATCTGQNASPADGQSQIMLAAGAISVEGKGVTVDGTTATITAAGSYSISGSLPDGQIVVDTADEGSVRLILDGVAINNATSAPLFIRNAQETIIVLADDSENVLSDAGTYLFASADEDEPNAALFSNDPLTIYGNGSLTVDGNYNDGISTDDGLIISGGAITVDAVDDGIRGKDYLVVKDGAITVTAGGDGLKSDEDEDASRGYVTVEGGEITVATGGDAITAATDVLISGGVFDLTTGGSEAAVDADTSAKGIKAGVAIAIDGGAFTIDAADDALHSDGWLTINGGEFAIATGDDGLHADGNLEVNGGVIGVTGSYEGLEGAVITINDGQITVVSINDGINVAGGNDGPGQDAFTTEAVENYLYVHGGTVVVDAAGDGIDANGAIEMTGGVVIVNGPTEETNGALDYDTTFTMSGGFLVAAGSAGMAQTAGASSTQNALLLNFDGAAQAGTLVHIRDAAGNALLTFAPTKTYQSVAFSSPALISGETYTVYTGGSASGASLSGLYEGAVYQPGAAYTTFTVTGTVTVIGDVGTRRP